MSAWWQVDRILGLYGVRRPAAASSRPLLKTRRESLEQHPEGVLSALLTRLTAAAHDELSETQQVAWLVATYDLAVRSGGHSEYFAVFGVGRAAEVRAVFERLGAGVQRQILADAITRHMSRPGETGFVDPLHAGAVVGSRGLLGPGRFLPGRARSDRPAAGALHPGARRGVPGDRT